MRLPTLIFSIAFAFLSQSKAQNIRQTVPPYEGYITRYAPDSIPAYQTRPLWGVKNIKAKVVNERGKPIKEFLFQCIPCNEPEVFFEWDVSAKGGLLNQEFIPLGIDSFYVQFAARGFMPGNPILVTSRQRTGNSIDLGMVYLKNWPPFSTVDTDWEEIVSERKSPTQQRDEAEERRKKPLFGINRIDFTTVDEQGQSVTRPTVYVYPCNENADESTTGWPGAEKGKTQIPVILSANKKMLDSCYIEIRHPYMQPVRMLLDKRYADKKKRIPGDFHSILDLDTIFMKHK